MSWLNQTTYSRGLNSIPPDCYLQMVRGPICSQCQWWTGQCPRASCTFQLCLSTASKIIVTSFIYIRHLHVHHHMCACVHAHEGVQWLHLHIIWMCMKKHVLSVMLHIYRYVSRLHMKVCVVYHVTHLCTYVLVDSMRETVPLCQCPAVHY